MQTGIIDHKLKKAERDYDKKERETGTGWSDSERIWAEQVKVAN